MEKTLLSVLQGKTSERPPVWLMRQAGRYLPEYREVRAGCSGFLDLCYSPQKAAEVTLQPIRRFGFDAAILFSDILVIPDALGQVVRFVEGEGPKLTPVQTADALSKLSMDGLLDHLEPVFKTVRLVKEALPAETTLIGFCGAPWTVATYMVGGSGSPDQRAARMLAYGDSELFQRMTDLLVEASSAYLVRQIEAGADVIQIFDTWAGSLPPAEFDRWVKKPTAEIVRRVREAAGDVPVIGFPRGAGDEAANYVGTTGVNGLGLDWTVRPEWIAARIGSETAVQGNLDPLALLSGGDALLSEVDQILEGFFGRPHIFNLGHGILPETPINHVEILLRRIRG